MGIPIIMWMYGLETLYVSPISSGMFSIMNT